MLNKKKWSGEGAVALFRAPSSNDAVRDKCDTSQCWHIVASVVDMYTYAMGLALDFGWMCSIRGVYGRDSPHTELGLPGIRLPSSIQWHFNV